MSLTDTRENPFVDAEQRRAAAWKQRTPTLPEEARAPAPYMRDGRPQGLYSYCLPPQYSDHNLLPAVRRDALEYFEREAIVWHQHIGGRPTNHLLSSQVQCINALGPADREPQRLVSLFGDALDLREPLEIEPGRNVAFEYIGERDYLGERPGELRSRGSMTTSADAAIRYGDSAGRTAVALIEWKYTEDYRGKELSVDRKHVRPGRYRAAFEAPDGPLLADVVPYEDMFVEPLYQLMRQQILAWEMERAGERGADIVRVVHVSPRANAALRASLNRESHRAVGADVFDVWRALLRFPDRFVGVDAETFLQTALTGDDYVDRYG